MLKVNKITPPTVGTVKTVSFVRMCSSYILVTVLCHIRTKNSSFFEKISRIIEPEVA